MTNLSVMSDLERLKARAECENSMLGTDLHIEGVELDIKTSYAWLYYEEPQTREKIWLATKEGEHRAHEVYAILNSFIRGVLWGRDWDYEAHIKIIHRKMDEWGQKHAS